LVGREKRPKDDKTREKKKNRVPCLFQKGDGSSWPHGGNMGYSSLESVSNGKGEGQRELLL